MRYQLLSDPVLSQPCGQLKWTWKPITVMPITADVNKCMFVDIS